MSLRPQEPDPIPEETARLARQVCPNGCLSLWLRDELGSIFRDELFADLYAARGHPAAAPWRLALVTVLQFAEGLTDRQAAHAVCTRIDWKYALSLPLNDAGFDFSVLSEFRARLVTGAAEYRLFDALLTQCQTRGWLKARGRQRTDSTHVLAAIRVLSRLECVGETLRQALNALAVVAPAWLQARVPTAWYERYAAHWEDFRLPSGRAERQALAEQIGTDGRHVLCWVDAPDSPEWLREVPAVQVLRRVWIQQFYAAPAEDPVRWRTAEDLPPSARLIATPYDPDARYSQKRETIWTGYKMQVTESCDDTAPHLLTDVQTTPATTADFTMLPPIQQALVARHVPPHEHFVDAGYVTADHLLASRADHAIDLVGPLAPDGSWQARSGTGYGAAHFTIDWAAQTAHCPQGHASCRWMPGQDRHGHAVIRIKFAATDCQACPVRPCCTRSPTLPRQLTIRAQATAQAIAAERAYQQTAEFKARYATRAGIEGTLSQAVRAVGARRCRYLGEAKSRLQQVFTALAINIVRLVAWEEGRPLGHSRRSAFAALAPAA